MVPIISPSRSTVVKKAEKKSGHAFSGGRGLSYHLTVHTKLGKIRSYGNGVEIDVLEKMLKKEIPEFRRLDSRLD